MSRRKQRRRAGERHAAPAPLAPAELPDEFRERMSALLGPELDAFLKALAAPGTALRVNSLRIDPERFRAIAPFPLRPLPYPPEGFLVPDDTRPGAHPYHAAGLYYLQDAGAMVVGALPPLPPEPRVLDLAAAPGGKATHLGSRMAGRGVLVANDVTPPRARELAGNLERCGVTNAVVTSEGADRLRAAWGAWFDLVLVDAPCSGESMFHKSQAARREWSPSAVAGCARRQGELMEDALGLVRPGGVLVYSTCTFSPEENEGVIAALLRRHPELELMGLPEVPGTAPAEPDWAGQEAPPGLARALRLWPHRLPGAGHFIAAVRRARPSVELRTEPERNAERATWAGPQAQLQRPPAAALERMMEFMREALPGLHLPDGSIAAAGEQLYLVPSECPPLEGIRTLRLGWWLGTDRKGRFEPAHALALGVQPAHAAHRVELTAGSAEVRAYLHGETLRRPGPDGWVLVTVDGFSLGWGKRSGEVVKNHYPRGLRRP